MIVSLLFACSSYFATYFEESKQTLQFISLNQTFTDILGKNLKEEDVLVAKSIVAPEISQYSPIEDKIQIRTLYLLYEKYGTANFSIGMLQMKPSFAEQVEKLILLDSTLRKKYRNLIINTCDTAHNRRIRIERLSQLSWQLEYLSAFMQIASNRLNGKVLSINKRIQYIATMYNSGLLLDFQSIENALRAKQFPHWSVKKFNYAECVLEFYHKLKSKNR